MVYNFFKKKKIENSKIRLQLVEFTGVALFSLWLYFFYIPKSIVLGLKVHCFARKVQEIQFDDAGVKKQHKSLVEAVKVPSSSSWRSYTKLKSSIMIQDIYCYYEKEGI